MRHKSIKVEAYAGYKGAEMPRFFFWEGKKFRVKQCQRTWYQEDEKGTCLQFFLLVADDNNKYLISYSQKADQWYMEETVI